MMKKIKLPADAQVSGTETGLPTFLIKIPGMLGWDITSKLAEENGMTMLDFCKATDIGVYCDHVILDSYLTA